MHVSAQRLKKYDGFLFSCEYYFCIGLWLYKVDYMLHVYRYDIMQLITTCI